MSNWAEGRCKQALFTLPINVDDTVSNIFPSTVCELLLTLKGQFLPLP